LFDRITELLAAAQHGFPKAVIDVGQIDQNPNRPFAAPATDASHAEKAAVSRSAVSLVEISHHFGDEAGACQ
jgi:hypothetical protein